MPIVLKATTPDQMRDAILEYLRERLADHTRQIKSERATKRERDLGRARAAALREVVDTIDGAVIERDPLAELIKNAAVHDQCLQLLYQSLRAKALGEFANNILMTGALNAEDSAVYNVVRKGLTGRDD